MCEDWELTGAEGSTFSNSAYLETRDLNIIQVVGGWFNRKHIIINVLTICIDMLPKWRADVVVKLQNQQSTEINKISQRRRITSWAWFSWTWILLSAYSWTFWVGTVWVKKMSLVLLPRGWQAAYRFVTHLLHYLSPFWIVTFTKILNFVLSS